LPENAEQLMRSRYSAYALGELDYLKASWHADFLPADLVIDERIGWLGLTIISSNQLGFQATVEFEARLLLDGRVDAMHENSNFVSVGGRWLYTDGEMLAPRCWRRVSRHGNRQETSPVPAAAVKSSNAAARGAERRRQLV
jgi:SEC-C motif-containing protein